MAFSFLTRLTLQHTPALRPCLAPGSLWDVSMLLYSFSRPLFCSTSRLRAMAVLGTEGRGSFSCPKSKTEGSPKVTHCHVMKPTMC